MGVWAAGGNRVGAGACRGGETGARRLDLQIPAWGGELGPGLPRGRPSCLQGRGSGGCWASSPPGEEVIPGGWGPALAPVWGRGTRRPSKLDPLGFTPSWGQWALSSHWGEESCGAWTLTHGGCGGSVSGAGSGRPLGVLGNRNWSNTCSQGSQTWEGATVCTRRAPRVPRDQG